MRLMKVNLKELKRTAYVLVALFLSVVGIVEGLLTSTVYAFPVGAQVQTRSLRLSSSASDAAAVTYKVTFTAATSHTVRGIIVDFCDSTSTPIIGDSTCNTTNLSNFTVGASPSITPVSGITGSWTATALNSGRTLKVEKAAGDALTGGTTVVEFDINSVHNPNFTGTFYARLITYDDDTTDIDSYAPGTEGNTDAIDYGGFALSTANTISITAKVQESMTFCVSGADPTTDCGGTTAPSLTIGHGANTILDSSAVDTAQVFLQISTNAQSGVVIRMKNTAASGGLNSGSNSIPPTGDTVATITAGTAAFGMRLADGTGGTGTLGGDANYESGTQYGMDASTGGVDSSSVLTTYGDPILSSSAPVNNVESTLTFAATASNTTPAGLYTATIILIATGSF